MRTFPGNKVEAKSAVGEGAAITCEQTCRVKVDADNVLTLAPGTILAVGAFFHAPLVPAVPPAQQQLVPAHEVKMSVGHIVAVSPNERGIPLAISGPGTTHIALRGAEVQVAVKGERMVAQVNEGSARAGSNKRWVTIERAQTSTLTAQGYPTEPRDETQAPEWKTGEGCLPALGVVEPGKAASVGVCWEPRRVRRFVRRRARARREFLDGLGQRDHDVDQLVEEPARGALLRSHTRHRRRQARQPKFARAQARRRFLHVASRCELQSRDADRRASSGARLRAARQPPGSKRRSIAESSSPFAVPSSWTPSQAIN